VSFDNRQFNINGEMDDYESFATALKLAFKQTGCTSAKGYKIDPKRGMILYWTDWQDCPNKFPYFLDPDATANFVWAWLKSTTPPKNIEMKGWDGPIDHDGSDGSGWRMFCEDWGHIETSNAFIAIKPIVCWYGK
jgi:hypothetical protein